MKLYIANCSRQKHIFTYKLPEKTQQFMQPIPAGSQIMLENNDDVIHRIIDQHKAYGIQDYRKTDKNFSGICYSTDKPISASSILDGSAQKVENLKAKGEEILAASAVAYNNLTDQAAASVGQKPLGEGLHMEIVGEAVNTDQADPPSMNKKITVKNSK
jgi:hypothetical protein